MIVTVEPILVPLPKSRTIRSEGIHVSSIIRCIATECGVLKPEWCEELDLLEVKQSDRFDNPTVRLRIAIGLAWEEWYIPQMTDVVDHPGEMCSGGIYMTHDAEELSVVVMNRLRSHRLIVHEVKATYKSIKTVGLDEESLETIKALYDSVRIDKSKITGGVLQDQWMWMAQLKSYCYGAGTRFAKLHVLFLCGDYSYPLGPVKVAYNIEFTQKELDDNMALMMDYRDDRLKIERGY